MIGALGAALAKRRRAAYTASPHRRRALARPVISVGNLSVGGTGKTPLVAHVARVLQALGHSPAILSRGYARPRPVEGAVVVSDGRRVLASYETAGDEPLMLARQLPGCAVIVSPDRYLAGSLAERRLGCTVHILDDGFQHLQLARALDLVVVTARDLDDGVMPAGRLREPIDALAAADAVVIHAEDGIEPRVRAAGARRVFTMTRVVEAPRGERVLAFAGIGRPEAFFDALTRAGWTIAARIAFADHRRYTAADLDRLEREASRVAARVLATTEKDAARLDGLRARAMTIVPVRLSIGVDPHEDFVAAVRDAAGIVQ